MYTLTDDMKGWLQDAIDLMQDGTLKTNVQNWLNTHSTVTDQQLADFVALFNGNSIWQPQAQAFSDWVKGGDRPANPHG